MNTIRSLKMQKRGNLLLNIFEMLMAKCALTSKPLTLQIETTTYCNLKCIMCGRQHRKDGPSTRGISNMDMEVFKKLTPLFVTAKDITIVGCGEPLMDKHFLERLDIFKQYDLRTTMITNGMLINDYIAEKLVKKGFDIINVSLEGGTKKTYEKFRIGASFDKLKHNINNLNIYKKKYNLEKPVVNFLFLSVRSNIEELPQLVKLAKELDVSSITVRHMNIPNEEFANEPLLYYKELTIKMFNEAKAVSKGLNIKLLLPAVFPDSEVGSMQGEENVNYRCSNPWTSLYVHVNGNIQPCCFISHKDFGNIVEKSPDEIWNGELYKTLRKTVMSNTPSFKVCKNCSLKADFSKLSFKRQLENVILNVRRHGLKTTLINAYKEI